ncbi:MAG TPA: enoyl-ACP reductase [Pyrinomonadaceae bacterium]|jgi:enoyl-[acyl-carrier protein] reductase I|nr:enoyl-ACP reductase [Pyrinomonadaceae bacterium]
MLLENRFGIIFGVANKRSIAWATAQALSEAGARLAFTYQGERLKENVESLTAEMPGALVLPCDVTKREEVEETFRRVGEEFGRLDMLVHSVAYAPKEALEGEYLDTLSEDFATALEVSAYSLVAVARGAAPLMTEGGSIVSMTYYGAEKVVPNYNVMGVAKAALEASTRYLANDLGRRGIRVNTISAGPINTLSARVVSNMNVFLKLHAERSPLRRNVEAREVGNCALFLCSPLSSAITGEVIHVDCGFNIMAV